MQPSASPAPCLSAEGGWFVSSTGSGRARAARAGPRRRRPLVEAAGILPRATRHCRLSNFQVSSDSASMRDQLMQGAHDCPAIRGRVHPRRRQVPRGDAPFGRPAGQDHLAVGVLVDVVERYRVHARFADSPRDPPDPGHLRSRLARVEARDRRSPRRGAARLDELGSQQPTPWCAMSSTWIINHGTPPAADPVTTTTCWTPDRAGL